MTSATDMLSNPHSVGRGEKNYYDILTPPGGVKISFLYFSPPWAGVLENAIWAGSYLVPQDFALLIGKMINLGRGAGQDRRGEMVDVRDRFGGGENPLARFPFQFALRIGARLAVRGGGGENIQASRRNLEAFPGKQAAKAG
jgi:hypothetical protein